MEPVTVTVLITAYNEEEKIERCLDSILEQTFRDMEILVINDGSKDRTGEIVRRVMEENPDRRIRLIDRENRGRVPSLNEGIWKAEGKYIAIQDADDYSLPERLEKQTSYFAAHPEVDVLGTAYIRLDDIRGEKYVRAYPEDDASIKREMCKYIPMCQGSVMMKSETIRRAGGYDESCKDAEDLDLWLRLGKQATFANLREPYYVYDLTRQNSFFHTNYGKTGRNLRVFKLNCKAVRIFGLPVYSYLFPLGRLAYPYIPNWMKKTVRRHVSKISETDRD